MNCGIRNCDQQADRLVIVHVLDHEYEIPRCPGHASKNDSFKAIGGKR